MGELGCDSQQQTRPVPQASEPTPGYALKTDPHRAWLAATPTHHIVTKAIAELFCQATEKRKREQREKYNLNPDEAKMQTPHHACLLLQITKQWPLPLSQIHYTQAI